MRKGRQLVLGLPIIDAGWMGGAIYIRNLAYCLASLPPDRQPIIRLIGNVDPAAPAIQELARISCVEAPGRALGRLDRIRARVAARLPKSNGIGPKALAGIDVTFPTFGPGLPDSTPIFWIPDFQHLALPHFFTDEERAQRDRAIRDVAERPGTLVLSSHAAAADFRAAAPDARVDVAVWRFCTVLTNNEAGGADPHVKYRLPEHFAYLPNQFWAHKNHVVVFEALALLAQRGLWPTLVCTGQEDDRRNPQHMTMLRQVIAERGLTDNVRFLGLIPRSDQIEVFRRAAFVIQPSLFEGWSTVVEDSKTLGRPILLSDLPVHREQVEEGGVDFEAEIFDPRDPVALADAIGRAWTRFPPGELREAAERARGAAERRCETAAIRLLDILHQARESDLTRRKETR